MMVRMDIDSHDSVQGHDPLATGNPQQPSRVKQPTKQMALTVKGQNLMGQGHNLWWGPCNRRKCSSKISWGNQSRAGKKENQRLGHLACQHRERGNNPSCGPRASNLMPRSFFHAFQMGCRPHQVYWVVSKGYGMQTMMCLTPKIPRICTTGVYGEPGHRVVRRSSVATKAVGGRLGKHKGFLICWRFLTSEGGKM
jgi:hypothetical protein